MNANVLIVDDCCEDVEIFERLIRDEIPRTTIYKVDGISEAYRTSMEHDINLFLINGMMEHGKDGTLPALDFARRLRGMEKYYITPMLVKMRLDNHVDYLLQVLHAYACIEKPFDEADVRELVRKTLGFKGVISQGEMPELIFREGGMYHVVRPAEIMYVEGRNHDVMIVMDGRRLRLKNKTLVGVLEKLDRGLFTQCSRNYAVNLNKVVGIDNVNRYAILLGGVTVDVGVNYMKSFKEKLNVVRRPDGRRMNRSHNK